VKIFVVALAYHLQLQESSELLRASDMNAHTIYQRLILTNGPSKSLTQKCSVRADLDTQLHR
jgi:hypothetical protein